MGLTLVEACPKRGAVRRVWSTKRRFPWTPPDPFVILEINERGGREEGERRERGGRGGREGGEERERGVPLLKCFQGQFGRENSTYR